MALAQIIIGTAQHWCNKPEHLLLDLFVHFCLRLSTHVRRKRFNRNLHDCNAAVLALDLFFDRAERFRKRLFRFSLDQYGIHMIHSTQ